jgi:hypothetical protein
MICPLLVPHKQIYRVTRLIHLSIPPELEQPTLHTTTQPFEK